MSKQAWLECWFNRILAEGNGERLAECAVDPFIFHLPGGRELSLSHEQYGEYLQFWNQRFRDMSFSLEQVIEADNKLVAVYQCSALYCGGWLKVPAKNQIVTMTGIMVFRMEGDLMAECWLEDSSFDLYQQLTRYLE
ncbi:nuclear transport factor 2 family protein [Photobacterium swingsii]|uniref:nuclear transport factor 2 family protein n=1 Tax=Photobacterium swingsii TaxID=680026 RepID=UPI0040679964